MNCEPYPPCPEVRRGLGLSSSPGQVRAAPRRPVLDGWKCVSWNLRGLRPLGLQVRNGEERACGDEGIEAGVKMPHASSVPRDDRGVLVFPTTQSRMPPQGAGWRLSGEDPHWAGLPRG